MKIKFKYINLFIQPKHHVEANTQNVLSNYYYDKSLIRKKAGGNGLTTLLENQNEISKINILFAPTNYVGCGLRKINYTFKHKRNPLCSFQATFIKNFFYNKNNFVEQKNTLKVLTTKRKKYLTHFRSVKGGYLCFAGGIFGFLPKTQSMRLIALRGRRKNIIYENTRRHAIRIKSRIIFYTRFIKNSVECKTKSILKNHLKEGIKKKSKNKNKLKGVIKKKMRQILLKNLRKPFKHLAMYTKKLTHCRNLRILLRKEKTMSSALNWYKFTITKSIIKPILKIKKYRRRRKIRYVRYKVRRIKRKSTAYKKYINVVFLCNHKFYYYNKYKKKLMIRKKKNKKKAPLAVMQKSIINNQNENKNYKKKSQ